MSRESIYVSHRANAHLSYSKPIPPKQEESFGAKHAEAIFVEGQTPEKVMPSIDIIKKLAKEKYACDPESIKFIAAINIIAAETDEAAEAKRDDLASYGDGEGTLAMFGGWTGIDLSKYSDDESMIDHWTETVPGTKDLKWTKSRVSEYLNLGGIAGNIVGGPKTVADELERWADVAGIDGFNLYNLVNPGTFEDIEFVLPELRARGLFREKVEKEGITAREVYLGVGNDRLLADHPEQAQVGIEAGESKLYACSKDLRDMRHWKVECEEISSRLYATPRKLVTLQAYSKELGGMEFE